MKAIVAVDRNWGIGKEGDLLLSIPEDMKFFRETTSGGVVVMGRKTLDSFPGGRPLKNRTNIVLTRNSGFAREGVKVVHSEEELRGMLSEEENDRVFVIGGASIYSQLLHLCDTVYVTKMDVSFEADAFFPDLDAMEGWKVTAESPEAVYETDDGQLSVKYKFLTYQNE